MIEELVRLYVILRMLLTKLALPLKISDGIRALCIVRMPGDTTYLGSKVKIWCLTTRSGEVCGTPYIVVGINR